MHFATLPIGPNPTATPRSGLRSTAGSSAVIVVSDTIKETSRAAIAELRDLGLTPVLLTGDNRRAAHAVAAAGSTSTR